MSQRSLVVASTKTYTHSQGLSCCFRQWRAGHSHCQYLHGYALRVKIEFRANELDERNWVVDFGGMKAIKSWLEHTFDHRLIVAEDDPQLNALSELQDKGLAQIVTMPKVGMEAFAEYIFNYVADWLIYGQTRYSENDEPSNVEPRVKLHSVEVAEHEGNSAIVYDAKQVWVP